MLWYFTHVFFLIFHTWIIHTKFRLALGDLRYPNRDLFQYAGKIWDDVLWWPFYFSYFWRNKWLLYLTFYYVSNVFRFLLFLQKYKKKKSSLGYTTRISQIESRLTRTKQAKKKTMCLEEVIPLYFKLNYYCIRIQTSDQIIFYWSRIIFNESPKLNISTKTAIFA